MGLWRPQLNLTAIRRRLLRGYGFKSSLFAVLSTFQRSSWIKARTTLRLRPWYGRLGNNIQQLCVGIHFANNLRIGFESLDHPLIQPIVIGNPRKGFKVTGRCFFFASTPLRRADVPLDPCTFKSKVNEIGINVIYPALKIAPLPALLANTLVIHLRGGDVYDPDAPVMDYCQNPVSYFLSLISKFSKVIVVYEKLSGSKPHPVLEGLLRGLDDSCDRLVTQSSSVENDFGVLLAAQHLASSGVGTFAVAAALISPNLKKFYCTDLYLRSHLNPEMLPNEKVEMTHLTGYIPIGAWDTSQRTLRIQQQFKVN